MLGDSEPIWTYEQACWALLSDFGGLDWVDRPLEPLPPEARIVARIYWVTDKTLRADLAKRARSI